MPTKGLSPDRCLLGVGTDVLELLQTPSSVSNLWSRYTRQRSRREYNTTISFDWFVLALDLLFAIGAVALDEQGRLGKNDVS